MRKLWPLRPPAWQRALLVAYPFPNCSAVRRIPGIEATIRANDGSAERLLVWSNARPSAVSRRANAAPMSTVAFEGGRHAGRRTGRGSGPAGLGEPGPDRCEVRGGQRVGDQQ